MNSPLELYQNFDPNFFKREKPYGYELGDLYKLNLQAYGPDVEDVLIGKKEVVNLDREFWERLRELIPFEEKPAQSLRRISEQDFDPEQVLHDHGITPNSSWREYIGKFARTESHLFRLYAPEKYTDKWKYYSEYGHLRKAFSEKDNSKNKFCQQFVIDYLQYAAASPEPSSEAQKVTDILDTEGPGTHFFWTFAPYVHVGLQEQGLSSETSMNKVINWVKEAWEEIPKEDGRIPVYSCSSIPNKFKRPYSVDLAGYFILGLDERMPSHLQARLLAKGIARGL